MNVWKHPGTVCTRIDRSIKRWLESNVKVGHAGTLDPFAEGVLPVAFGCATRLIPFILRFPKTYRFTCVWGTATDTQDPTGVVIGESSVRPTYEAVEKVLPSFIGSSLQKPSLYSAVKVNGTPAYALARKGCTFDLPSKLITIHSLSLLTLCSDYDGKSIEIEMSCASGTYVRAFARDLAENLGTLAYVSKLVRTSVGPFSQETAIGVDELTQKCYHEALNWVCPIIYGLEFPVIDVNQAQKTQLWNGLPLSLNLPFFSDFWICKYQEKMICLAKEKAGSLVPYRCFVDM
ncbi:tRNA pseudouridine(55) synthase TruB [Holospora undulata]|uniref:tRNA pseudouridine(55) synthase TruB n=1 Tax=Holospora undulata TaxID=1169117 RepID=UPI000ACBF8E5|nr:tRNA pseudouridine(55) synthase TruB [Holospora undulata]